MSDNVRQFIIDELDIPDSWRVIGEQRVPDVITSETVVLKHETIRRLTAAPASQLQHDVILAVFIPNQDLARAEDRLDDAIAELLPQISRHPKIGWNEATKVITPNSQYPGWEVTLTVITENTTESEAN